MGVAWSIQASTTRFVSFMSGALPLKSDRRLWASECRWPPLEPPPSFIPEPEMRRSCLFFLDHYDCDGSVETFRQALRDPVSFVRESALHGLACERCRYEAICVTDVVGDLIELLAFDPSPDVRHKTLVALGRFLERDTQAPEAVARTAQSDSDAAIRFVAREMASSGQPYHRSRKAALRDERRARRTRL